MSGQLPSQLEVWGLPSDLECLAGNYVMTEEDLMTACYTREKQNGEETDYFLYFCAVGGGAMGRWNMGDTKGSEMGCLLSHIQNKQPVATQPRAMHGIVLHVAQSMQTRSAFLGMQNMMML